MRERILQAMRFAVDISILVIYVSYLFAIFIRAAIWGGEGGSDWDGWAGSYMLYSAILPFFLVNAAYLAVCLVTGTGIDRERLFWLWASMVPFAGLLIAWLMRAATLAEATHVGLYIVLTAGNLFFVGAGLWLLGRWSWARLVAWRRRENVR
jgi:hypothetical protein